MGRDKATLPFGDETLLQRAIRRVRGAVDEVLVVARPGQELPPLPSDVRVAWDEAKDRGPLMGLLAGLEATGADAVFATAADAPFLVPAVVDLLFERAETEGVDIAVAEAAGFLHPLTAVYGRRARHAARRLIEGERFKVRFLYDEIPTTRVGEAHLRAVDPDLDTLANVNTVEAYDAAVERFEGSCVTLELYEMARRLAGTAQVRIDEPTVRGALEALRRMKPVLDGEVLDEGGLAPAWRVSVNGLSFLDDLDTRLRPGDALVLVSAMAGG